MTIKLEAAFHEAGHAVAAHRSRFHNVVGPVNLADYGAGEIYVSLSKKKLLAEGKVADASVQREKEVATDLAVVLSAGLVAEYLAEEKNQNLKANPVCAEPDYELMRQQLLGAGLSENFDAYRTAAKQLLETEWELVSDLAAFLMKNISAEPSEVVAFIEDHPSRLTGDAQPLNQPDIPQQTGYLKRDNVPITQIIEPEKVFSADEIKRLQKWIARYKSPLLFFLHSNAEQIFREFDEIYFQRTGISETEYLNQLVGEVRRQASLAFTEMPNGANDTMFHYPEARQPEAYKAFEARAIASCADEENRLRFKAYVARRFGLRVPLKSQP